MLDPIVKLEIAKRVHFYVQVVGWAQCSPQVLSSTQAELQAFLEDHSPDVVTLNEAFTKKGYKYNMPHYPAVTRNREHRKRGGVAILLRQNLNFTEIDDIQLTKTTDNEQLTVAIRTDSNRELYVSTIYCPRANSSIELIDVLCENRDQVIFTSFSRTCSTSASSTAIINSIQ